MNLAPVLVAASLLAGGNHVVPGGANRTLRSTNGVDLSSNWSGYALLGKFHQVSGVFTVPPCEGSGMAAEWVGVDGFSNNDLIQAGVSETQAVNSGCELDFWWEILPAPSVSINWMNGAVGDQVRVSITHEPVDMSGGVGPWAWRVSLYDLATGQDFSQQFNYSGPAQSAEWIVEAPSVWGNIASILPYQEVSWSSLSAYGRSAKLSPIRLVQGGAEQSVPSSVGTTKQLMREGFSTTFVGPT